MIDLNDAPLATHPVRYDLDAIVARLRDTAHAWVPGLFPNGRRQGDEWRLANINGAPPRNSGSCVITLRGEHAGNWHDFDGSEGGGPLSSLAHGTGLSDRALFAHAADMTGWTPSSPPRQAPPPAARGKRDASAEIAHILKEALPLAGTPAERYLAGRGLAMPGDADLLFHPDLTNFENRIGFPAMIGRVRDGNDRIVALHRTYLAGDGETVGKAPIDKPRLMLGPTGGGTVRLAPIGPAGVLGLCEGIETGLAVMTACPGLPVWAALSTSGLEHALLPPEARRIVILADHDASGAGLRAAEATAAKLRLEGRAVCIVLPPAEGYDFNDMLQRDGAAAISVLVDTALRQPAAPSPPAQSETGRHLPIGFVEPQPPLPQARSDEGNLDRATARAWYLLLAANRTPWLFRLGGEPNWVVPDDDGRPAAMPVREERLRHMLAKLADWRKMTVKGDLVPTPPPTGLVKSLIATPDPALPVLAGIVTAPVFGRGGVLLTTPGYHPDARLLYQPPPGFVLPDVPVRPSQPDIDAARALLLDDLLGDFPFTGEAERAHVLALLLLGFVRPMIEGPTPLHMIEKPTPGTGATLMVDAIATILTGTSASVMTEGRDEDEWRKRLTAKLRQLPVLLLIDNLRQELDSAALAAALTAPAWEDRLLGASDMIRLPVRCAWVATANNPTVSHEIARRLVRIRLDARTDQPWRRDGFRHPDLMVWVRSNRARLVAACLTLCRAWIAAGRPRGPRSLGSFEGWSNTLSGILDVAGVAGFLANLDDVMEASDTEGNAWLGLVVTWWERFGTAEVSVSDLFGHAQLVDPPLPISAKDDGGKRVRLGLAIRKLRDRAFRVSDQIVHIRAASPVNGAQRWRLIPATAANDMRVMRVAGGLNANPNIATIPDKPGVHEGYEGYEGFSNPYACARAHIRAVEAGKPSEPSEPSESRGQSWVSGHEGCRESSGQPSEPSALNEPAWLDGVP